jgi:hypothetical protein
MRDDGIPGFAEAVRRFESFLGSEGFPTTVLWTFRDDFWQRGPSCALVRWFPSPRNAELAEKVFSEGRAKGLVQIAALAQSGKWTIATVWYPKYDEEEVQGWSEGLKLSIRQPLPVTLRIPSVFWMVLGCVPGFRRYQQNAFGIGTKKWAAA